MFSILILFQRVNNVGHYVVEPCPSAHNALGPEQQSEREDGGDSSLRVQSEGGGEIKFRAKSKEGVDINLRAQTVACSDGDSAGPGWSCPG